MEYATIEVAIIKQVAGCKVGGNAAQGHACTDCREVIYDTGVTPPFHGEVAASRPRLSVDQLKEVVAVILVKLE